MSQKETLFLHVIGLVDAGEEGEEGARREGGKPEAIGGEEGLYGRRGGGGLGIYGWKRVERGLEGGDLRMGWASG